MNTMIRLRNGKQLDVFRPNPALLDPDVIAWGLSGVQRWGSQAPTPFTVAEHSVALAFACPAELRLVALLHDAAEGLGLQDLPGPIKHHQGLRYYRHVEEGLLDALGRRYEVALPCRSVQFRRIHERLTEVEREIAFADPPVRLYTNSRQEIFTGFLEALRAVQTGRPMRRIVHKVIPAIPDPATS